MRLISHIISLRILRRPKTRQKWEWILDFHLPGGREKWLQVDANSALCLAVKPSSELQSAVWLLLLVSSFLFPSILLKSLLTFGNISKVRRSGRRSGGEAPTFLMSHKGPVFPAANIPAAPSTRVGTLSFHLTSKNKPEVRRSQRSVFFHWSPGDHL